MPRRETGVLVRLRIPGTAVHVAKSAKRPIPALFRVAKAASRRLRSAVLSVLAFLRTRTIKDAVPMAWLFAELTICTFTSRSAMLGRWNRPAEPSGGAMGGLMRESGTMSRWFLGRRCLPTFRLRV